MKLIFFAPIEGRATTGTTATSLHPSMPKPRTPTREDILKAEREIGENLPDAMVGEDDGDVRKVEREHEPTPIGVPLRGPKAGKEEDEG